MLLLHLILLVIFILFDVLRHKVIIIQIIYNNDNTNTHAYMHVIYVCMHMYLHYHYYI